jgi:hypothetical protein
MQVRQKLLDRGIRWARDHLKDLGTLSSFIKSNPSDLSLAAECVKLKVVVTEKMRAFGPAHHARFPDPLATAINLLYEAKSQSLSISEVNPTLVFLLFELRVPELSVLIARS